VLEEVDLLKKGKGELQMQLASLRKAHRAHLDTDHDVSAQLGKLKYQNEVNRDQKAAMGREIAQRDVMIKELRLDVDDLNNRIAELEIKLDQRTRVNGEAEYLRSTIRENDASHARDAETHQAAIHELELTVKRLTVERDVAVRANVHSGDHATRAQDLTEALTKREKMVTDLRQKMLEEQMRVTDLEDEVERLRELVNKENLDDIKEKLRAKSSDCDRFRTELKGTEHQLKLARSRLMTATNNGDLLRGAAHIVAPNEKCRLPKRVMACSGCYANNLPCDNGARCANCTLNNKKCARWRCSLKHKLMVCDRASCAPPHDPEGWLVSEPRPEW
jgi:chromosome segregation ATPase